MRFYLYMGVVAWLFLGVPVSQSQTLAADVTQSFATRQGGGVWTAGGGSNPAYDQQFLRGLDPQHVPQTARYKAIGAGSQHAIGLNANGTVRAWGMGTSGELGSGTDASSETPVLVSGLTNVVSVSANQSYSLALKADGSVWAWGSCLTGQLGNAVSGPYCQSNVPVQVQGLPPVIAIAAGGYHGLALAEDGSVYAWGNNQSGQLGDGTSNPGWFGDPPVANDRSVAAVIPGLNHILAISAGFYFSAALTDEGQVYCWGSNINGQVGDGTTVDRLVPTLALVDGVVSISSHGAHVLALKGNGEVWSWGSNYSGELGNGSTVNNPVPAEIAGLPPIIEIAGGGAMSMARDAVGHVWTWGYNIAGQLGDGTSSDSSVPIVSKY